MKEKDEVIYTGPEFILNTDKLQIGDIILERGYTKASDIICKTTNSKYSHAMLYVGDSIIEATPDGGVFSRIPNRSTVRNIDDFLVLRSSKGLSEHDAHLICDKARYLIGSKYSIPEAILVKVGGVSTVPSSGSRKQFCSRLVAQSYLAANINLVNDTDYCSPGDFRRCESLSEVPDMVRLANEQEVNFAREIPPHKKHHDNTISFIDKSLDLFKSYGIKTIGDVSGDILITTLNDIEKAAYYYRGRPNLDSKLTAILRESGYMDHIHSDRERNPFRYDYNIFSNLLSNEEYTQEIGSILNIEFMNIATQINDRLRSYSAAKSNLSTDTLFSKAQYEIRSGLLTDLLQRLRVLNELSNKNSLIEIKIKTEKMIFDIIEIL